MGQMLGFSESTVHRSLKKLTKMGLVLTTKLPQQRLGYSVETEQPLASQGRDCVEKSTVCVTDDNINTITSSN